MCAHTLAPSNMAEASRRPHTARWNVLTRYTTQSRRLIRNAKALVMFANRKICDKKKVNECVEVTAQIRPSAGDASAV